MGRWDAHQFYTYDGFIVAARSINGVSTTGDSTTRKGKLDSLLAQTSHETQVFSLF